MIRYKTAEGWKRGPVVRSANGRIKPEFALIEGKPVKVERYYYEVRYYENRQVQYENAGKNAPEAETLRRRIENQTTAKAIAESAGLKVETQDTRKTLRGTAEEYIQDALGRRATEAAEQARVVRDEFLKSVSKTYMDEVTRTDILKYHESLRKKGRSDRTISNKHARLASWLRFAGYDKSQIPPQPKYEKQLPTIYSQDQISSILGAADCRMYIVISLALKCGFRDQEIQHLEWSSIDFAKKVLLVRGNPKWGFKVRDSEQRSVPIPADLLNELTRWKKMHATASLVVGTDKDRPSTKLLRELKELVRREKLGCGHCKGCKAGESTDTGCKEWTLHKFRRTYATRLLRSGLDLSTVQKLMGHSDLASTMRYLSPAESDGLQDFINGVKW